MCNCNAGGLCGSGAPYRELFTATPQQLGIAALAGAYAGSLFEGDEFVAYGTVGGYGLDQFARRTLVGSIVDLVQRASREGYVHGYQAGSAPLAEIWGLLVNDGRGWTVRVFEDIERVVKKARGIK